MPTAPGVAQQCGAYQVHEGEDGDQDQGGTPTVHLAQVYLHNCNPMGPRFPAAKLGHAGFQLAVYICANGIPAARSSA